MKQTLTFILFLLLPTPLLSAADLRLASVFSDHMVLQREQSVPVWGVADAGESITVKFANQTQTTTADKNGKWIIELDSMKANAEPQSLIVQSNKEQPNKEQRRVELTDVLVGEVWLASGQSNMEWEMQRKPDSKADIPNSTHPNLRLFAVPLTTALTPQDHVEANWTRSSPETSASFSAIGYYFGLRLHEELGVPVGMIQSAWGGTRIEPWTSVEGVEAVPTLKSEADRIRSQTPGTPAYRKSQEAHLQQVQQWTESLSSALDHNQAAPPLPTQPATLTKSAATPTTLYNAMIHPLVPMAIRGAIWYQGEANRKDGLGYVDKKKALLASWRNAFKQPELPFYFVQIAPYQYSDEDPEMLARFWVAQRECMKIPHTGMSVITDIAELKDIHPQHKKEVARRLSLWALADTYDQVGIDPSGPLYENHKVDGATIRVTFNHADSGLASRGRKPLTDFEIAGIDGNFHPATATIDGNQIVVQSANVPEPKAVRFGWNKLAMPNLMDKDGLPACSFHTHWPIDPSLGDNVALGCTWESSDPNVSGWNTGLTDGVWGNRSPECFATGKSEEFPKSVTIDLKKPQPINLVRFGVPDVGSTKTVAISVSHDGKTFQEVGSHSFGQGKAERAVASFDDTEAKYVRLTFQDHHAPLAGGYSNAYAFTSEVEVYQAK
ncbi:F5/8 type C domain protein [Novipirellula galeiformis]|uniref:F5/8 type C domain protein n=1 Tax=Novipirellula galeiformis TaxID=2528004 RepID=A0A5C6C9J8_9BACT|nr:sialate O-acetylesterase [Novipirellula galeiformis]TWU20141.1 F5/8 type C domain protein [Novipirellula galeiformis]